MSMGRATEYEQTMSPGSDTNIALGRAVAELRKRTRNSHGAPLTQRDLALLMGLKGQHSAITVSRIERGDLKITRQRVEKLAEALGVTVAELERKSDEHLLQLYDGRATHDPDGSVGSMIGLAIGGPQYIENRRRRSELEARVQDRQWNTERNFKKLRRTQEDVVGQFFMPLMEQFQRVQQRTPAVELPEPPTGDLAQQLESHRHSLTQVVIGTLGGSALGAGLGAAAGGGAAAVAFALVSSYFTASTGVAISQLSGAAATSAAMAWLGGGPLAAGGLGVAGGALVLTGIITLPTLVAAGGALWFQSRKVRERAASEADRLDEAWALLEETDKTLTRVWQWMRQERELLDELADAGLERQKTLQAALNNTEGDIVLEDLGDDLRRTIQDLQDIAVSILTLLGLPILDDLSSDSGDASDSAKKQEWIDLVLGDVKARVKSLHQQPGAEEAVSLP